MKKYTLISLLVVFMMILVACGSDTEAPAAEEEMEEAAESAPEAVEEVELTMASWGNDTEVAALQSIIDAFEAENPNVSIELLPLAAQGFRDQAVIQFAAGEAPDILRAGFRGDFAFYAASGATLDLTPYLEEGFADDFFPAAWTIATYEGRPYGIPLHSDTHALFYNVDYIEQAGITVPTSMDECWSWDEFSEQSQIAMENSDADFGHAALWNGKRWMLFLYGNGGRVLNDDLTASEMNSDAAIETIAWTQSWYTDGITPLSTSMKNTERAIDLFINGTIGFFISGSWHMPNLRDNMTSHDWDVTYLPCTPNGTDADLGGTGFVVNNDTEHPDAAVDFLVFMTNTENMQAFTEGVFFNPVRYSSLEGLEYPEFNDQMQLFTEVAATVDAHHAAVQGMSIFPGIQTILQDELDLAFVAGQTPEQTAENIHNKITQLLAEQ